MLAILRSLFVLTVSFISNLSAVLLLFLFLRYCTPDALWTEPGNALVSLHIAPTAENIVLGLSLATIILPCLLYRTAPAQYVTLRLMGAEKAEGDDLNRLQDALLRVCKKEGSAPEDYNLYVTKDTFCNACAFGDNHILVTKGALDTLTTRELSGILAHETGHLRHGDTSILSLIACMGFFGNLALWLLYGITRVCCWLSWIPVINIGAILLSWTISISTLLVEFLVCFPGHLVLFFFSRQDEYDADRYACELGLAGELYDGLQTVCGNEFGQSFTQRLWATHPVTKKRLKRIRKFLDKAKDKTGAAA